MEEIQVHSLYVQILHLAMTSMPVQLNSHMNIVVMMQNIPWCRLQRIKELPPAGVEGGGAPWVARSVAFTGKCLILQRVNLGERGGSTLLDSLQTRANSSAFSWPGRVACLSSVELNSMSTFVLQIQDLEESGTDWNFAIRTDWLASALADTELKAGTEDGRLTVHAQPSGTDVLVQGHIDAQVAATCARCLADVPIGADLALTTLYSPEHMRPKDSDEIDVRLDEVNRDYYSGSQVVLDPMVRELLLLDAPMKPLCSESCEGIAVPEHLRPPEEVFGGSAPDARFAPLLKLKEALTKNEE